MSDETETAETGPAAPAEEPITLDQARAQVGRMMARSIEDAIAATEEELAGARSEGVAEANARLFLQAAKELHDALLVQAKRFERPLILRPRRSVRVVRS